MLTRLGDLCRCGWWQVASGQRRLLSLGNRRHQTQVVADGMAGGTVGAQRSQPRRARCKWAGSLGQSNARNRPLGEGLNLAGCEDARHE